VWIVHLPWAKPMLNLLYGVYICGREGEIVGPQVGQFAETTRPLQGQGFHARG